MKSVRIVYAFWEIFRGLSSDVPINWKIGNKVVNPSVIKEQSLGRIYINSQMHIIFESLKFEDTNIYR